MVLAACQLVFQVAACDFFFAMLVTEWVSWIPHSTYEVFDP